MSLRIVLSFALLGVTYLSSHAAPPEGWWTGPGDEYKTGVDRSDAIGPCAYIEAVVPEPKQFAVLNQTFSAEKYRGKRVRLKGLIKTKDVSKWAGFWLRADSDRDGIVAFDNMQKRGVVGTKGWTVGEIVLDIPVKADKMYMGLILDGSGKAWMSDLAFEVVDDSVALTTSVAKELPKEPVNLDFTKD